MVGYTVNPRRFAPAEIKSENAVSMFGLHLERRAFSLKMSYSKPKARIWWHWSTIAAEASSLPVAHFLRLKPQLYKPTPLLSLPGLFKKINSRLDSSDGAFHPLGDPPVLHS
jgi:hypothetical protein